MYKRQANEFAIEGTLAYQLARNVVGGITAKYVYSHIADYSSCLLYTSRAVFVR